MHDLSPDYWEKISSVSFSFHLPSALVHEMLFYFSLFSFYHQMFRDGALSSQKNSIGKNGLYPCEMIFHENTIWFRNLLINTPSSNIHPKSILPKSIEINYDLWFVPCQKSKCGNESRLLDPNSVRPILALLPDPCS